MTTKHPGNERRGAASLRLAACGAAILSLCLIIGGNAAAARAADEHHDDDAPAAGVPESKNQIIKLTDKGIEPPELTMKREDSIVFFLNDSTDALATISIDFKGLTTHCATTNLQIGDNGVISSVKPMQPKEFASVCFHDAGSYPLTVYGLKKDPKGVTGTIVVQ